MTTDSARHQGPARPAHGPAHGPAHPAGRRRRSLVLSVLAILSFVGLVPLVLMGWQVAGSLAEDLEANQKEIQLDKAQTLEKEISGYVLGHFDRLHAIASAVSHLGDAAAQGQGKVDVGTIKRLLEEYVDGPGGNGMLEIRLVPQGSSDATISAKSRSFDAAGIRQDLDPVVLSAVEMGRTGSRYLSNPFVPRDQSWPNALAVLAEPLDGVEGMEGTPPVLVAVVSMGPIQSLVQAVGDPSLGYTVFVVDENLKPFAHTRIGEVVGDRGIAKSALLDEFSRYGMSATSLTFDQPLPGGRTQKMIGTFAPISLENHRWGVFVEVPRAMGLFQVEEMRRTTVMWGLLAFGLAVVIGVLFTWRLTRPIHELADVSRRVAGGDYARRARVHANNEIGMLADNFNTMAEEIGKTIDDLKLQKEMNDQLFISSIRSLAAAIDARDPYTRGHSERVTRYARIIARQLKLGHDQVRHVEIGALLHDVGKIGIEDRILRKPAALTPEEFEIMKAHPEKGGQIMEPISFLREATEVIIHHHERWDGQGYPSGLQGDEIPIGARIVNVADTFDAMTTNRPYQRAMTFAVAAKKIGEFSGKACDPAVVEAFQRAFEAGLFGQIEGGAQRVG